MWYIIFVTQSEYFTRGVQLCDFVLLLFPCVKDCVTTSEVHIGVCFACKAHFFYARFSLVKYIHS